jgi:hypothetical protein
MGDGSLIINPGTTVTGVLPGAECASSTVRGQLFPLDMYVMMDRSVSMGSGTQYLLPDGSVRWDTVIKGFQTFVALPEAAGIGMGIQFFGAPKVNVNCDPTYYARPWVEIGLLPDNGPAILGAFSSVSPGGGTPMNAALEGAIAHARDWKLRTPDRNVIVVLVTDGWPNGCGLDAASVGVPAAADAMSQIAAAGLAGTPSVQTFVLGIADPADMDMAYIFAQIAAAGGTATPVIVATDNNLATEFSTALNQIRNTATLPCSYQVPAAPAGQTLDYGAVNVVFTPTGSAAAAILNVPDSSSCGAEAGWYYDNNTTPGSIELCPASCSTLSSGSGSVDIVLGCATVQRIL